MKTSYFANARKINRNKYFLISIALGNARCKIDAQAKLLAPKREWIGLEYNEYESLYLGKLNSLPEDFFIQMKDAASPKEPVFLCFESLKNKGQWCHRRLLAEWIEEKYN